MTLGPIRILGKTGTSLQPRITREVISKANDIYLFLFYSLVPVPGREYEYDLLGIFRKQKKYP